MSKYIRTKDGVYEVNEIIVIVRNRKMYELSNVDNLIQEESLKKIIISQSDTIEELCDEFVFIWNFKYESRFCRNKEVFLNDHISRQLLKTNKDNKNVQIYGAIWTDKGLIYVAKLNDKGELELI